METALEAGVFLKERHPRSEIVVRDLQSGQKRAATRLAVSKPRHGPTSAGLFYSGALPFYHASRRCACLLFQL
jgi:hypothetical protein